VNRPGGQLVFIDTPGFHESDRRFNQHMRGLIEESIRDAELILYVVDASRPIGAEEATLSEAVSRHTEHVPTVVVINKVDIANSGAIETTSTWLTGKLPDCPQFRIVASTGKEIEPVLTALIERAPEGEPVYPEDHYTDQPPEFRVSEIIREKAINSTSQEVPHSLYVEIADMEVRENEGPGEDTLWIRAFLLVERESQKGILVGKAGVKIKDIRQTAQKEIAKLFPYRIHLDLRVKVDPKWRRKEGLLQRLVT
jgi:GTPase